MHSQLTQECDIVGAVIPTPFRVKLVDFTHPALYNPAYFMIPVAKSSNNLLAPVLPFQAPVWRAYYTFVIGFQLIFVLVITNYRCG